MSTSTAEAQDLQLIDRDGLASLLKVSRTQTYRLERDQGLPSPIRLGALIRWRVSDIQKWLLTGATTPCPRREQHEGD